jgi:hypothetical protein
MKGLTRRIPPSRTCAGYSQKWTANIAIIGYARVSTQDQDFACQVEALKAAGATRIHREKVSGARADRPQLAMLMMSLKRGDAAVVTKIDRVSRSTHELLELIHRISEVDVSFPGLGDPLFSTDSSQGKLLVTLLAAIAGFERDLIREHTGDGGGRQWRTASSLAGRQSSQHSNGGKPSGAVLPAKRWPISPNPTRSIRGCSVATPCRQSRRVLGGSLYITEDLRHNATGGFHA